MKTIIRGSINVQDRTIVKAHRGAKLLKIAAQVVGQDSQGNPLVQVFAWMEMDTSKPIEYRTYAWVATGGQLPIENHVYVDSIFMGVELHLYELPGAPVDMTAIAKHEMQKADEKKPSLITRG